MEKKMFVEKPASAVISRRTFLKIVGIGIAALAIGTYKLTDIIAQRNKYIKMRQAGQYKDDLIVRKQIAPASHLNKMIPKFYTEFGEKPLSEVTEALLHTHYEPRIPTFPMEV